MSSITDKQDWDTKINNEDIVARWRQEALSQNSGLTEKMFDWCIAELAQEKAEEFQQSGIVRVFDHGVFKSDVVIDNSLREKLIEQVLPL